MTTTATGRPATDKQIGFMLTLVAERVPDASLSEAEAWARRNDVKAVSAQIERLMALPRPEGPVLDAGIYRSDGVIYRVYEGKAGRMLAKTLLPPTEAGGKLVTEYAGLATRFVKAGDRLSVEEVEALSLRFGRCYVCGRTLSATDSVKAGIGPVCRTRV